MSVSVAFEKVRRVVDAIDCDPDHDVHFFYRLFRGDSQRFRAPESVATASTLFSELSLMVARFLEDELTFIARAHMDRKQAIETLEKQFELCVWYKDPPDRLVVLTSTDNPERHDQLVQDAPSDIDSADETRPLSILDELLDG